MAMIKLIRRVYEWQCRHWRKIDVLTIAVSIVGAVWAWRNQMYELVSFETFVVGTLSCELLWRSKYDLISASRDHLREILRHLLPVAISHMKQKREEDGQ